MLAYELPQQYISFTVRQFYCSARKSCGDEKDAIPGLDSSQACHRRILPRRLDSLNGEEKPQGPRRCRGTLGYSENHSPSQQHQIV